MYNIKSEYKYFYCQWNFDLSRWEYTHRFKNKLELLDFVAEHSYITEDGVLLCNLYDRLNFTGKDLGSYSYVSYEGIFHKGDLYFRNRIFFDSEDKTIDIRLFENEVKTICYENSKKRPRVRHYYGKDIPYIYRYDPVPKLTKHWHLSCRRWKTWCHTVRQDSIPEYQEYVRNKAKQPNKWVVEPFTHFEKSWKHQTKRRRQWEKKLPKHIDTVVPTKYEYLKELDDLMVN